jgi:Na+-transporting methylmalonyl-CoA/oxaloacetate decarboxylase beta subunit
VIQLQCLVQQFQARQEQSVEMTPEKQAEMASVAQAEGVSLPVARRLLQVLMAPQSRSVPTLGRATLEAGVRAGGLLEVLDEAARPLVQQGAGDEIFLAENRF